MHSCVIPLRQKDVKGGYAVHFVTAIYIFHIQLLSTHMFRVYVLMFILEGELKSYAHAFGFVSASTMNLMIVHHE
jgi:hypothetical protein